MNANPIEATSRFARLAQRLIAALSPRSVAAKLYMIAAIALVVLVALGAITILTLDKLDTSSQRVAHMYEASQRAEDLFRSSLQLARGLDDIAGTADSSLMSDILAQNETLASKFASYRSTVEEYDLSEDSVFILESEPLILLIREDVYLSLNLQRAGSIAEATEIKKRVDRNILHLGTALEQIAQQRQFALADETKILDNLQQQQIWFMAGIFAVGALLLLGASFGYSHSILTALKRLSTSAGEIAAGNYLYRITTTADAEIAQLAVSFNHMTASVQERQEQVEQQRQTIEQRAAELERTLAELRTTVDERDELNLTVRELASPVLPIAPGLLVMPLIGVIDTERVALLNRVLLAAIERYNATMTIIDVTGVPIIDTQVARALIDAAKAARLLGSRTVLVGLRPELAQTLVGLGVSLTDMATQADLQSGIRFALQHGMGRGLPNPAYR